MIARTAEIPATGVRVRAAGVFSVVRCARPAVAMAMAWQAVSSWFRYIPDRD